MDATELALRRRIAGLQEELEKNREYLDAVEDWKQKIEKRLDELQAVVAGIVKLANVNQEIIDILAKWHRDQQE